MRKMMLSAALACLCGLLTTDTASACGWGRGWGCGYGGWGCGCYSDCGYYGGRGSWGGGYYGGYCSDSYYGGYCYNGYLGSSYVVPSGYSLVPSPAPATLVVDLPADAVLTIDGERTTSTSGERVFRTPALEQGREFEYTLEARVIRDGKEKVMRQRATVRAGEQTTVRLGLPATAVGE
jgi:uncharacterized protein (TIGR03000 family)